MRYTEALNANWKLKFFTIWVGQAFSLLGSGLVDFALIWWLTDVTGSEQVMLVSTLITLIPRMVLGPFAGTLIDHADKKRVMIIADGAIAVVTLGLMACALLGAVSTPLVMGMLLLRSLGGMFHQPALKSATAVMFPAEQQARIGGFNRVLSGAMSILTPVAGALMIELFDLSTVLLIDVITACIAISTLLPLHVPHVACASPMSGAGIVRDTMDGLRYVWRSEGLRFVVLTCTAVNICLGPCNALKSLLIKNVFGGGAAELSMVTAAQGAGLLIGGMLLGVWGGFRRNLITGALGWCIFGVSYIGISLLTGDMILGFVACSLFAGVALAIGCAGTDAYYVNNVPQEYHGRVFSVLITLDNTTVPLGLIVAAFLSDIVPIQTWYLITGILHLTQGIYWMNSRRIREAENPDAVRAVQA